MNMACSGRRQDDGGLFARSIETLRPCAGRSASATMLRHYGPPAPDRRPCVKIDLN
jgi:hypothetical protein